MLSNIKYIVFTENDTNIVAHEMLTIKIYMSYKIFLRYAGGNIK